jgi:hypothetical protein
MKRQNTLQPSVQLEAKTAFRQLRLRINRLERTYRQHRPEQYRDMPPLHAIVVKSLVDEAKRQRGQVTLWLNVVEGNHPARLIYTCAKLDRRLAALEINLEWERRLATTT